MKSGSTSSPRIDSHGDERWYTGCECHAPPCQGVHGVLIVTDRDGDVVGPGEMFCAPVGLPPTRLAPGQQHVVQGHWDGDSQRRSVRGVRTYLDPGEYQTWSRYHPGMVAPVSRLPVCSAEVGGSCISNDSVEARDRTRRRPLGGCSITDYVINYIQCGHRAHT